MVGEGDGADPAPVRRRRRGGAVGAAARPSAVLETAAARGLGRRRAAGRARATGRSAWSATRPPTRRYIWPVDGLSDLRLAPFHVLAAESGAFAGRDHGWHLSTATRWSPPTRTGSARTDRRVVEVTDPGLRGRGHRVVGGDDGRGRRGDGRQAADLHRPRPPRAQVQPGIKVRGREYLRIIYGPEYDAPGQLDRLRSRGLGRKRSLASREFALGRRGPGALRAPRAAVPRARVRLRGPGAGVRAGRSATVTAHFRHKLVVETSHFRAAGWGYVRQDNQRFPSRPHPRRDRRPSARSHHPRATVSGRPDAAGDLQTGAPGTLYRRHDGSTRSAGHRCHRGAALAAVLACGPGSALRRLSLAKLHGVSRFPAPLIEVVSPRRKVPAPTCITAARSSAATSPTTSASRSRRCTGCSWTSPTP